MYNQDDAKYVANKNGKHKAASEDKEVECVLKAKTYVDLPQRYIISFAYSDCPYLSYGIIAFSGDTKRWLMVKRRHSAEYAMFIRGSFRISELKCILYGMSRSELKTIRGILRDINLFDNVFTATIYGTAPDIEYAKARIVEARHIIQDYIEHVVGTDDTEWIWPKGRAIKTKEYVLESAAREFSEETGVTINGQYLMDRHPIVESFIGLNSRTFTTYYWVYLFPREIPIPPLSNINRPGEVGDRRWLSEYEIKQLARPPKIKLLESATQRLIAHGVNTIPKMISNTRYVAQNSSLLQTT